ncbi:MAG: multiheme c-type cytochrome, partial [Myxococcota bacterium]
APVDPLPTAYHRAAEAEAKARVPDPARGGPPVSDAASPLPPFLGVSRADARYVGADTCAACHPTAAGAWKASAHAHALATLKDNQAGSNPSCLPCHVTGFGHPGGWAGAATPTLADVGCEACHGPGSAHVAAPAAGYGDLPRGPAACVACHTHDNSPDFRFDAYWPAIVHGREG